MAQVKVGFYNALLEVLPGNGSPAAYPKTWLSLLVLSCLAKRNFGQAHLKVNVQK